MIKTLKSKLETSNKIGASGFDFYIVRWIFGSFLWYNEMM